MPVSLALWFVVWSRSQLEPGFTMRYFNKTRRFAARALLASGGIALCAGCSLLDPAVAGQAATQSAQPIALGRQTFENRCAGCHGLDGRGGERAPDIARRTAAPRRSDAALAQIIRDGLPSTGMPAFSTLDDSNLRALVAYLRFLQGRTGAAKPSGNPARGKALFFGKARCAECHTLAGAGGFIASDLSVYGRTHGFDDIRQAILTPSNAGRPAGLTVITARDGNTYSGIARNEDNFSLQLQTLDGAFHLFLKSELAGIARDDKPVMPADYGATLGTDELNDLIVFLMSTNSGKRVSTNKRIFKEDEENE